MRRSHKESIDVQTSLGATARTATANGSTIDLQNCSAAVFVFTQVAWTDGSHALSLQESDDNSTFTAVAAGDMDGTPPTVSASGTTVTRVGYMGAKRYVRARTVVTGSPSTGAVYGVQAVLEVNRKLPK